PSFGHTMRGCCGDNITRAREGCSMAKTKAKGESLRGYFIDLFRSNPDLVRANTNAEVVQRWEKDHPGQRFTKSHQNALANAKTKVAKELGIRKRRKKRRAAGAP